MTATELSLAAVARAVMRAVDEAPRPLLGPTAALVMQCNPRTRAVTVGRVPLRIRHPVAEAEGETAGLEARAAMAAAAAMEAALRGQVDGRRSTTLIAAALLRAVCGGGPEAECGVGGGGRQSRQATAWRAAIRPDDNGPLLRLAATCLYGSVRSQLHNVEAAAPAPTVPQPSPAEAATSYAACFLAGHVSADLGQHWAPAVGAAAVDADVCAAAADVVSFAIAEPFCPAGRSPSAHYGPNTAILMHECRENVRLEARGGAGAAGATVAGLRGHSTTLSTPCSVGGAWRCVMLDVPRGWCGGAVAVSSFSSSSSSEDEDDDEDRPDAGTRRVRDALAACACSPEVQHSLLLAALQPLRAKAVEVVLTPAGTPHWMAAAAARECGVTLVPALSRADLQRLSRRTGTAAVPVAALAHSKGAFDEAFHVFVCRACRSIGHDRSADRQYLLLEGIGRPAAIAGTAPLPVPFVLVRVASVRLVPAFQPLLTACLQATRAAAGEGVLAGGGWAHTALAQALDAAAQDTQGAHPMSRLDRAIAVSVAAALREVAGALAERQNHRRALMLHRQVAGIVLDWRGERLLADPMAIVAEGVVTTAADVYDQLRRAFALVDAVLRTDVLVAS